MINFAWKVETKDNICPAAPRVSLPELFWVMLKIGTFTIGGGYAMLLMIQQEVTRRRWISEEEFPDLIALSQAAPGLLAVNISIFAGYKLRGVAGAIVATLGSCFSPFIIILCIALFFSGYADNPYVVRAFKGMRPAVVALIAVPMVKMARNSCKVWWQWVIAATALGAVAFLDFSPVYILLTTIVLGIAFAYFTGVRSGKNPGAR